MFDVDDDMPPWSSQSLLCTNYTFIRNITTATKRGGPTREYKYASISSLGTIISKYSTRWSFHPPQCEDKEGTTRVVVKTLSRIPLLHPPLTRTEDFLWKMQLNHCMSLYVGNCVWVRSTCFSTLSKAHLIVIVINIQQPIDKWLSFQAHVIRNELIPSMKGWLLIISWS